MIFGYDSLVAEFKRLAADNSLAQTYLFFGDRGVGKFLFAKSLANYLENGIFEEPKGDLRESLIVDFSQTKENPLEGNLESVGIETIRQIESFLFQKPVASRYRVAIIRDAEWLTLPAQNALLKIVEEPPSSALIIAIVQDFSVFLPTLASRFLKVYFPRLSLESTLDFLSKYCIIEKLSENERKKLAERASGRIGYLLKILEEKKEKKESKDLVNLVLSKKNTANLSDLVEKIITLSEKNPLEFDLFFEELIWRLREKLPFSWAALAEVNQTFWLLKNLTVNKRIQIKKMLLNINF